MNTLILLLIVISVFPVMLMPLRPQPVPIETKKGDIR